MASQAELPKTTGDTASNEKQHTPTALEPVLNEQQRPPAKSPNIAMDDDEPEYVTGFKLTLIVASVALGCFLMLIDTMVISTVCLIVYSPE